MIFSAKLYDASFGNARGGGVAPPPCPTEGGETPYPVECVLMHNITIFPFFSFCIDLFIQVAQSFFLCAGNFVRFSCRKNRVDAIKKKKSKTTINTPNDRLCIPEVLFTSLEKYLTCYT